MTDQLGLGGNLDVSDTFGGQIAALGMRARRAGGGALGLKARPKAAPAQQAAPDPQAAAKAKLHDELTKLFTPIEQGGALRTTASPARMVDMGNGQLVAAPLPDGYSWAGVPKAILAKIKMNLPDGVKPIGFEPSAMSEMQQNAMTWMGQQKEAERQAEADQMQAQQQQQASPDASKH